MIVGAGVYSVIGSAAGLAHQSLWLSFVVGAGVAMLTRALYALRNYRRGSGLIGQRLRTGFPLRRAFVDCNW